jgi:AcrR family transcriptional regulator
MATLLLMATPDDVRLDVTIWLVPWSDRSPPRAEKSTDWLVGYPRVMQRDAAGTRARILDAATAEFSAHGLAGARVDRIAAGASANKQLIYAYFGSKDELFDAVVAANLERLLDEVPFDAGDLPSYAQGLVDFGREHPDLVRLARWHALQRPGVLMTLPRAVESTLVKLEALAAAQHAGTVDATLRPEVLLDLIVALAYGGEDLGHPPGGSDAPDRRRDAVALAVRRLVTP